MKVDPRVLVGTLYVGEPQFPRCKRMLERQSYRNWDHVVFEGLPNKEAHERLYRAFMKSAGDYDLFLKLDADMVFLDAKALERAVDLFRSRPELDHAELAVLDWASSSLIMGLHLFSNRVEWSIDEERLFVDPAPIFPGEGLRTRKSPAPVVVHAPDPTPFQAFRFGVHRGLKALQLDRGRFSFRPLQAEGHWRLLKRIWKRFSKERIRVLGLTVLGADTVFCGRVTADEYDFGESSLQAKFTRDYAGDTVEAIHGRLVHRWGGAFRRELDYRSMIGPVRWMAGVLGGLSRQTGRAISRIRQRGSAS